MGYRRLRRDQCGLAVTVTKVIDNGCSGIDDVG